MIATKTVRISLILLFFAVAFAATFGTVDIAPRNVLRVTLSVFGLADASDVPESDKIILLSIRFPRVCLLILVGGALAIAGATLQAIFQNPMADPGVLGVTGGGAFGAVLSIYLGWDTTLALSLPFCAFAGALAGAFLVYLLAHFGGRPSTASLLLTGIAVGTLAAAGMSLLLVGTADYRIKQVIFWLVGGAEGRTWHHVQLAAPFILTGAVVLLFYHRTIDILALGEDHALSVGVAVGPSKLILLTACALVAGAAVSVSGSIAFVGLIVPHAIRFLVGARSRTLLPACFLGGGAFLVTCDLVARLGSGKQEIHLGILTAFLGVPFLLTLLYRAKRTAV